MKLVDYAWEIFEIAKEQDMDVGVARDMFVANMQNVGVEGAPYYAGAEDIDYEALGAEWEAMDSEAQHKAKEEFRELTKNHYTELTECRRKDDVEGFKAIVAAAVAEVEE